MLKRNKTVLRDSDFYFAVVNKLAFWGVKIVGKFTSKKFFYLSQKSAAVDLTTFTLGSVTPL